MSCIQSFESQQSLKQEHGQYIASPCAFEDCSGSCLVRDPLRLSADSRSFHHKYAKESLWIHACFSPVELQASGLQNGTAAFVPLLRACAKNKDLYRGTQIHDFVLKVGLLEPCSDALISMYAQCGVLERANSLLDMYKSMDVISWNAVLSGFAKQGRGYEALGCFERMQHAGIIPNAVTYNCVLKSCGTIKAIERGREIHDEIARQGLLHNNGVLGGALVGMYVKCDTLAAAKDVLDNLPFRDVSSWNALITGYVQQDQAEEALNCLERMQHEGIDPDAVTCACVLRACGSIGAIDRGNQIHSQIAREGLLQDNAVLGGALVDMYAKCGALSRAELVLEELPSRNVVSWNALITGYAHHGRGEKALSCFERMQHEGVTPNAVTYLCILKACATIGAMDKGARIHDCIVSEGLLKNHPLLGSALVDMYAKCGALSKAQGVLQELTLRDVSAWNALIAGYTQQGQGKEALDCFECMQREGISPDVVTLSCVLNACSHLGLVEEGHALFMDMGTKYGFSPDFECYTCMIDFFGRSGHLEKAVDLIQQMSPPDCSAIWHALLSACRKWGDVITGRWAFKQAVELNKGDGPAYVLMADIYAAVGIPEKANKNIQAMQLEHQDSTNSQHT